MGDIFIYSDYRYDESEGKNVEVIDFSTMGLCGALTPTEVEFHEIGNGNSTLTMTHPVDPYNRHSLFGSTYNMRYGYSPYDVNLYEVNRILKADVPVRNIPEILDSGAFANEFEQWRVNSGRTADERGIWTKRKTDEGKKKYTMPAGAVFSVIKTYANSNYRCKISYTYDAKYTKTTKSHKKGDTYKKRKRDLQAVHMAT